MTPTPHVCTYYCQDGLHAYNCLCALDYTAADVLQAAQTWATYCDLGDTIVRVFPARESAPAQMLEPEMIEVDPDSQTARPVTPVWVDMARYRPWIVLVRVQECPMPARIDRLTKEIAP